VTSVLFSRKMLFPEIYRRPDSAADFHFASMGRFAHVPIHVTDHSLTDQIVTRGEKTADTDSSVQSVRVHEFSLAPVMRNRSSAVLLSQERNVL